MISTEGALLVGGEPGGELAVTRDGVHLDAVHGGDLHARRPRHGGGGG